MAEVWISKQSKAGGASSASLASGGIRIASVRDRDATMIMTDPAPAVVADDEASRRSTSSRRSASSRASRRSASASLRSTPKRPAKPPQGGGGSPVSVIGRSGCGPPTPLKGQAAAAEKAKATDDGDGSEGDDAKKEGEAAGDGKERPTGPEKAGGEKAEAPAAPPPAEEEEGVEVEVAAPGALTAATSAESADAAKDGGEDEPAERAETPGISGRIKKFGLKLARMRSADAEEEAAEGRGGATTTSPPDVVPTCGSNLSAKRKKKKKKKKDATKPPAKAPSQAKADAEEEAAEGKGGGTTSSPDVVPTCGSNLSAKKKKKNKKKGTAAEPPAKAPSQAKEDEAAAEPVLAVLLPTEKDSRAEAATEIDERKAAKGDQDDSEEVKTTGEAAPVEEKCEKETKTATPEAEVAGGKLEEKEESTDQRRPDIDGEPAAKSRDVAPTDPASGSEVPKKKKFGVPRMRSISKSARTEAPARDERGAVEGGEKAEGKANAEGDARADGGEDGGETVEESEVAGEDAEGAHGAQMDAPMGAERVEKDAETTTSEPKTSNDEELNLESAEPKSAGGKDEEAVVNGGSEVSGRKKLFGLKITKRQISGISKALLKPKLKLGGSSKNDQDRPEMESPPAAINKAGSKGGGDDDELLKPKLKLGGSSKNDQDRPETESPPAAINKAGSKCGGDDDELDIVKTESVLSICTNDTACTEYVGTGSSSVSRTYTASSTKTGTSASTKMTGNKKKEAERAATPPSPKSSKTKKMWSEIKKETSEKAAPKRAATPQCSESPRAKKMWSEIKKETSAKEAQKQVKGGESAKIVPQEEKLEEVGAEELRARLEELRASVLRTEGKAKKGGAQKSVTRGQTAKEVDSAELRTKKGGAQKSETQGQTAKEVDSAELRARLTSLRAKVPQDGDPGSDRLRARLDELMAGTQDDIREARATDAQLCKEAEMLKKEADSGGCSIFSIFSNLCQDESAAVPLEPGEADFVINHVPTDEKEEWLLWSGSMLKEIEDVENSLGRLEEDELKDSEKKVRTIKKLEEDELKDSEKKVRTIKKHLMGNQDIAEKVPEKLKSSYYQSLSRAALLNARLESRKAELELRRIELESLRVEKEMECMMDSYEDEESFNTLESEEGEGDFFTELQRLFDPKTMREEFGFSGTTSGESTSVGRRAGRSGRRR